MAARRACVAATAELVEAARAAAEEERLRQVLQKAAEVAKEKNAAAASLHDLQDNDARLRQRIERLSREEEKVSWHTCAHTDAHTDVNTCAHTCTHLHYSDPHLHHFGLILVARSHVF